MGLLDLFFSRIPKDHDLFSRTASSEKAAIAFVHIPKTAGTWFSSFLAQHFTQDEIAPALHRSAESTDFSDPSKRLFAGHFRCAAITSKRPMRLVTFLRDPFERTASQYRSWHNKINLTEIWRATAPEQAVEAVEWVQSCSYEEYVHSEHPFVLGHIRDVQTTFLTSHLNSSHPKFLSSAIENLERKFFFAGVQERSRDSIRLFNYQTGSKSAPAFPARNISESYDVTLSTAGRERLLKLLANDLAVYEAGLRLFRKRWAAVPKKWKNAA
jgi:hypothetical protein